MKNREKMQKLQLEEKSSKEKIEAMQTEQLTFNAFIDQLKDILSLTTNEPSTTTDNEIDTNDSSLSSSHDFAEKIIEKVKSLAQASSVQSTSSSNETSQLNEKIICLETERDILDSKYNELKDAVKKDNNFDGIKIDYIEEIAVLKSELNHQKAQNSVLLDKYIRHRQVFLNNENNFNNEIEKMDNFIANIFQCLKSMPDSIKDTLEMKNFLKLYDEQMSLQQKATDCN